MDAVLTFSHLLQTADIAPATVRLLRHQDSRYPNAPSPYILWRDYRDRFEAYQSTQSFGDQAKLNAPIWASFVGLPNRDTLFVGLYAAECLGPMPHDRPHAMTGVMEKAGSYNLYRLEPLSALASYGGRLWIDWGAGYRSWIQRGDGTAKSIVQLTRAFSEPAFPGFSALVLNLSEIEGLPNSWAAVLAATRGIYLLTCPRTREQYIGMASGTGGFLARWREYFANGHGGNIALKSRDASDYQIAILETVGTGATLDDLLALEDRWKVKLQSRALGLNRN